MALINRISRLFKADFHAVLDRIEEPEQLLGQAIRDMQDELAGAEQRIMHRAQELKSLEARREEIQSCVADVDKQLDLCFASGREELARSLIRRQLEAGRLLRRLDARIDANASYIDEQRKLVGENRNMLEGLRQKAEVFAKSAPGVHDGFPGDDAWLARDMTVGDDEVEVTFLREKSRRNA